MVNDLYTFANGERISNICLMADNNMLLGKAILWLARRLVVVQEDSSTTFTSYKRIKRTAKIVSSL